MYKYNYVVSQSIKNKYSSGYFTKFICYDNFLNDLLTLYKAV